MLTAKRNLFIALCLSVVAAACGGGPTAPSDGTGTTISGMVNVQGGAAAAPGAAATGLTVSVVGTNLSADVESSGYFQLMSVPSGRIKLLFKDAIVNATVELSNVGEKALIEIQVQVSGKTATVVNEVRTDAKVSLCHKSNDRYHSITVSTSAESAHRAHGAGMVGEAVPGNSAATFDEHCHAGDDGQDGPKVQLCHKTGNGTFRLIEVSTDAEAAHLAHGDGKPGQAVPGQAGKTFSSSCSVN